MESFFKKITSVQKLCNEVNASIHSSNSELVPYSPHSKSSSKSHSKSSSKSSSKYKPGKKSIKIHATPAEIFARANRYKSAVVPTESIDETIVYSGVAKTDSKGVLCIELPEIVYPIPTVVATIVGPALGIVVIEAVTITSFKVHTYTTSNVDASYTFNWKVRGKNTILPSNYVLRLAGSLVSGFEDGASLCAEFSMPTALAFDSKGTLYIADTGNKLIRKINKMNSEVTTCQSGFINPSGIAVSSTGVIYVLDENKIYQIINNNNNNDIRSESSTLLSLGITLTNARGIAIDLDDTLYITDDTAVHSIKNINNNNNNNDGNSINTTTYMSFRCLSGITVVNDIVYVTDTESKCIFLINKNTNDINTIQLDSITPTGIVCMTDGTLVVSDSSRNALYFIKDGSITDTIGSTEGSLDGAGTSAQFNRPMGLAMYNGSIAIADTNNNLIRIII